MGSAATRHEDVAPRGTRARVPAGTEGLTASSADRRADDRRRTVSLSRDCIRIDRQVAGIAMRVAVPVQAYQGVALSMLTDAAGRACYRLHLLHADQDLSVELDSAVDDADILADWRLWSRFFRLPALVERRAGQLEAADPQLGGLILGDAGRARRTSRFRSKRRPAFLARRRVGDVALATLSHAGAREIIARD